MIRTFSNKATAAVFASKFVNSLPHEIQRAGLRRLRALDAEVAVEDLRAPPSNRLEALMGDRKGQWSIRINDKWRVCFHFDNGDAYDVEIADYH